MILQAQGETEEKEKARQEGAIAERLVRVALHDADEVRLVARLRGKRRAEGSERHKNNGNDTGLCELAGCSNRRACRMGFLATASAAAPRTLCDLLWRLHASFVRWSHASRTAEPPTERNRSCAALALAVGLYKSSMNSAPSSRCCRSCGCAGMWGDGQGGGEAWAAGQQPC